MEMKGQKKSAASRICIRGGSLKEVVEGKEQSRTSPGASLAAQWIRFRTPHAGGLGSIPGQGTRSHMHAATKEPACRN